MKRTLICLALTAVALAQAGCVERTVTITSDPPGALVFMSSVEVGRTPVKVPFTWYGDYEIILRQEGYQTLNTHYEINPPIYDVPPFDLLSAMAPWTYHYDKSANFIMAKAQPTNEQEIKQRAEELRRLNEQNPQ
jgi:hypothetical protein